MANHGGARPGAGRKTGGKNAPDKYKDIVKKTWGGRFHPVVWAFIKTQKNQSEAVETIIRNSPEFKAWKESI